MIKQQDAALLALTKLKTKRLLTVMSIFVSALLFGLLYAASIAISGATDSIDDFTREAFDSRYLVKSTALVPSDIYFIPDWTTPSDELMAELRAMETDYFTQQERIAEEHATVFDEDSVERILIKSSFPSSTEFPLVVNNKSPVYQLYLEKKRADYAASAENTYDRLKATAERYGALGLHELAHAGLSFVNTQYLAGGEEDVSKLGETEPQGGPTVYSRMIHSVRNSEYIVLDDALLKRFIFADARKSTDAIPVIVTAQEAKELFGESLHLPDQPEESGKIASWMSELEEKLNGATYEACYRNSADIGRISEAGRILSLSGSEESDEADLVYDLPKEACGDVALKYDNRSSEEKERAQDQEKFLKAAGLYDEPSRHKFKFQVVGLMYVEEETESARNIKALSSELLSMRLTGGAIIPKDMYDELPAEVRRDDILLNSTSHDVIKEAGIGTYIIELPSLDAARTFMAEEGCPTQDPCGKPFALEPYGSNYLLLDDFSRTTAKFGTVALIGVLAVAGIITFLTIGRVIASSRRETAVYRALGARRIDIAAIYTTYSVALGILIVITSGIVGAMVVSVLQMLYSQGLTLAARTTYGLFHSTNEVRLIGFDLPILLVLTGSILLLTVIAAILPILSNIRRNPIEDLRSE